MATSRKKVNTRPHAALEKCATGIPVLDQVTNGGLPLGRSTTVCGGSGPGKAPRRKLSVSNKSDPHCSSKR